MTGTAPRRRQIDNQRIGRREARVENSLFPFLPLNTRNRRRAFLSVTKIAVMVADIQTSVTDFISHAWPGTGCCHVAGRCIPVGHVVFCSNDSAQPVLKAVATVAGCRACHLGMKQRALAPRCARRFGIRAMTHDTVSSRNICSSVVHPLAAICCCCAGCQCIHHGALGGRGRLRIPVARNTSRRLSRYGAVKVPCTPQGRRHGRRLALG